MRFPGSVLKGCSSSKVSRHHAAKGSIYWSGDGCLLPQFNGFTLYRFIREREKARKTPRQRFPRLRHCISCDQSLVQTDFLLPWPKSHSSPPPPSICSGLCLEVPTTEAEKLIPIASDVVWKPINIPLAGTLTPLPLNMLGNTGYSWAFVPGRINRAALEPAWRCFHR